jgi:hypothetical protein
MTVVDTHGLVEADEVSASCHAGGELPVLCDVGVGEPTSVADRGRAQQRGRDRALEGGEPEQRRDPGSAT